MSTESEPLYLCPECHVGRLEARRVSYFDWFEGLFVTVPDFPAWVCDVCGWYEYDRLAVAEVQVMMRYQDPHQGRRRPRQGGNDAESTNPEAAPRGRPS